MTGQLIHTFSRTEEFALLPLCMEMGEKLPPSGFTSSSVLADVTCPRCLEWLHA